MEFHSKGVLANAARVFNGKLGLGGMNSGAMLARTAVAVASSTDLGVSLKSYNTFIKKGRSESWLIAIH